MTIHDDRDFHQLTGAFDHPIAPSAAFTDRLRNRISIRAEGTVPATVKPTHAEVAAKPIQDISSRSRRRWRRHLDVAAAIVIVFALIGAALQLQQPDAPNRLAFQDQSEPSFNMGGDAGHSGVYGSIEPRPGVARVDGYWFDTAGNMNPRT